MTDQTLRRRPRRPVLLDNTVPSPCIGVCWLDDVHGWCEGCWRSGDEIRDWMIMTADQKLALLELLEQRKQLTSAPLSAPTVTPRDPS